MLQKVLIPVITVLLLSSCAGKFNVVKRKHNKGFYVSTSKKHTISKQESVSAHTTVKSQPVQKNTEIADLPVVTNKSSKSAELVQVSEIKALQPESHLIQNITASAEKAVSVQSRPSNNIKPLIINKSASNYSGGDSDAKFLVLVILCFFWWLNLISVYVHDGHAITNNFWVTLLLDITIIGGIIFALLVVLDIVDLR